MRKIFLFLLFLGFSLALHAQLYPIKIIRVVDGDTVVAELNGVQERIRLLHIDAPEEGKKSSQPFGRAATIRLRYLCLNVPIFLSWEGKRDRNKRILGELFNANKENINQILVEEGLAWHYKTSKSITYARLEQKARVARRGLWSENNPIAPWDYRKMKTPKTAKK